MPSACPAAIARIHLQTSARRPGRPCSVSRDTAELHQKSGARRTTSPRSAFERGRGCAEPYLVANHVPQQANTQYKKRTEDRTILCSFGQHLEDDFERGRIIEAGLIRDSAAPLDPVQTTARRCQSRTQTAAAERGDSLLGVPACATQPHPTSIMHVQATARTAMLS